MEIDLACLTGFDFSSLRVIMEVEDSEDVAATLCLRVPRGAGTIVHITTIRIWLLNA